MPARTDHAEGHYSIRFEDADDYASLVDSLMDTLSESEPGSEREGAIQGALDALRADHIEASPVRYPWRVHVFVED